MQGHLQMLETLWRQLLQLQASGACVLVHAERPGANGTVHHSIQLGLVDSHLQATSGENIDSTPHL